MENGQRKQWLSRENVRNTVLIIAGSGLMAFGIQCVFEPSGMVTGGFSGLAIIIKALTERLVPGGLPLGLTSLLLNIPVFFAAYIRKGFAFIARALFAACMLSFWLSVLPQTMLQVQDMVLATAFGGIVTGVGLGMVFSAGTITGGTELVSILIQRYVPRYSVIQILQVVDGLIVLLGMFVFGVQAALYAIGAIYLTARFSDRIVEGAKFGKLAFVISAEAEEIAGQIMGRLKRGVTGIRVVGLYSGHEKMMLFCVVSKKEIFALKELVHTVDERAFLVVSDVREVLGEGFLRHK